MDHPKNVESVQVAEGNPYIELMRSKENSLHGFRVKKLIDLDTGIDSLQTLLLDCISKTGLTLQVSGHDSFVIVRTLLLSLLILGNFFVSYDS